MRHTLRPMPMLRLPSRAASYDNVSAIRIKTEKYGLLIMEDYSPLLGEMEGDFSVLTDTDEIVKLAPSTLEVVDDTHCLLTIKEGKTHQVRRMMAHFNRSVTELRRISIGDIKVPENKEGELIEMPSSEIEYLLSG